MNKKVKATMEAFYIKKVLLLVSVNNVSVL